MYGSPEGVAALAGIWTSNGVWLDDGTTKPSLAQVDEWLIQFSAWMDVALAGMGFLTPVSDPPTAVDAIDIFINGLVSDMAQAANSSGRFYTDRVLEHGMSPLTIVNHQIESWVAERTPGFIQLGVERIPTDESTNMNAFSIPPRRQL